MLAGVVESITQDDQRRSPVVVQAEFVEPFYNGIIQSRVAGRV
jgi:hypothetical protein